MQQQLGLTAVKPPAATNRSISCTGFGVPSTSDTAAAIGSLGLFIVFFAFRAEPGWLRDSICRVQQLRFMRQNMWQLRVCV